MKMILRNIGRAPDNAVAARSSEEDGKEKEELLGDSVRRYLAHGTATDYIYEIARVPMAFTFEIYGDDSAPAKDCFRMFNPTDLTTFKRVLNDWSAAFFTIFKFGPQLLGLANSEEPVKWISIDDYLDGYLMSRRNRYGKKMEVLELGLQEIRSYFRLFMLSCVILMFMFCTRISKSKLQRPIVSPLPP